ncbi:lytic transglycosylase domain-containing protein [Enterovirga rhinocerotis]|uniref:Transglycosylase-like protein with SLT domain n=1 Tax=Enterovirga rhinocerotis TaxID=1339210 RepID=A0A4R7C5A0_9HYPH|nr:lytic transglycosylase domain-containing protein [Enterovirga rhinocerotis]TDR93740.1 hypothetical protein EV668_1005 [Enterovirga rhinocerotis]
MFLFTTPTSAASSPTSSTVTAPPASGPIPDAIRRGAAATGTDFDYLLRTAKRESALDPSAKAPTSSATGLFQFIEQTWLGVVKNEGPRLGLANAAAAIVARPDGTYAVPDAAARQAVLRLREDPAAASAMAGALTRRNRDALAAATGRAPTNGELYLAHVLGARGAAGLIATARSTPDRAAALDFPEAARANRSIFYAKGGRARSVAEVYAVLTSTKGEGGGAAGGEIRLAATDQAPPGIYGLFQTGARRAPVSDAVARIWRGQTGTKAGAAAPFFPRSTSAAAEATAGEPSADQPIRLAAASSLPASAPLPPAKPAFAAARQAVRDALPGILLPYNAKVVQP